MNALAKEQPKEDNFLATYFLCLLLGIFGAHRFYLGKTKSGLVQLLTLGVCGIWTVIDLLLILSNSFTDKDGSKIRNTYPKLSWTAFVLAAVFTIASNGGANKSKSSPQSTPLANPASTQSEIYLCNSPASTLRLSADGTAGLMIRGNPTEGKWRKIDSQDGPVIEFQGNNGGAPVIFVDTGFGELEAVKYGYIFKKASK